MSPESNTTKPIDRSVPPAIKSLSDLATFDSSTNALALLQSGAGDFKDDMAQIFPGEWAWSALSTPRSKRMIWFSVLSGFKRLPDNCAPLRRNLLMVDLGLMLRLRFSGLAEPMLGIVSRIGPHPLPRPHYDELARMLDSDPSLIAWYAGQTGEIDAMELSEILEARLENSS